MSHKVWDEVKARHEAKEKERLRELKKKTGVDATIQKNPNPKKGSGTGGVRG